MIEFSETFLLLAFLAILICLYGVIGYVENNKRSEEIEIQKDAKSWLLLKDKCQKIKSDEDIVVMECGGHSIQVSKEVDKKAEEYKK